MKFLHYVVLLVSIVAFDAHAETIESNVIGGNAVTAFPYGSKTQVCQLVVFMTKNTGTLIPNLTTANLKLLSATQAVWTITIAANRASGYVTSPVTLGYSIAASTTQPGFYNLCVLPGNFSWSGSNSPNSYGIINPSIYEFDFIVHGTNASDNGLLSMKVLNGY